MMVTFVSQCQKKALNKTRRVLDAFANRIGDNTWQTVITNEGLLAVKNLLRKTATKNTAVSCHWIRSRARSHFLWVVGNRRKFNSMGIVAVNRTKKPVIKYILGSNWPYLSLVKSLSELAALFHDWGKSSRYFQRKLKQRLSTGDPIRHEWISCLFFHAYVSGEPDENWLSRLAAGKFNLKALQSKVKTNEQTPLGELPPIAQLIAWLIVTHHKLPTKNIKASDGLTLKPLTSYEELAKEIKSSFGYTNGEDERDYQKLLNQCFSYQQIPAQSSLWLQQVKQKAADLQQQISQVDHIMATGTWRLVLQLSRLSLMMGDHLYSSQDKNEKWQKRSELTLYANTDGKEFKQRLDEHLIEVAKHGNRAARNLPVFASGWQQSTEFRFLQEPSPSSYKWQDTAVKKINHWKSNLPEKTSIADVGFFSVNMASTGKGKTFANPKIMLALSQSADSLRYVLALGLRTLTLQTGTEYRDKFGKDEAENIGVVIGSKATLDLYNLHLQQVAQEDSFESQGSGSLANLLDDNVDLGVLDHELKASNLYKLFPEKKALKNMRFLYPAILVCTIDHMMGATETIKGGKHILPMLRLLSSDLVIDEVDNFDEVDLQAIQRLVHLAGMFGKKVMLSSATITPSIAEGFFNAYRRGWQIHANAHNKTSPIGCAWIDEHGTEVKRLSVKSNDNNQDYKDLHNTFVTRRSKAIVKDEKDKGIRRKGKIIDCQSLYEQKNLLSEYQLEQGYFSVIANAIFDFHQAHHYKISQQLAISFGVIRMANIEPCISLFEYLLVCELPELVEIKVLAYHSRQLLLMRHLQELHLDTVLKRKDEEERAPEFLSEPIISQHISQCKGKHLIFVLVATPVEEVGRDHDFDWAIIEPSSYASIIQLAGRVLRHRVKEISAANVGVMQYNLRSLKNKKETDIAFRYPGYEKGSVFRLSSKNLNDILNLASFEKSINAVPRIQENEKLNNNKQLVALEHTVLKHHLTNYKGARPQDCQSWFDSCWWMTGIPQSLVKFRGSEPNAKLWRLIEKNDFIFKEINRKGEFEFTALQIKNANQITPRRLWLKRDYTHALEQVAQQSNLTIEQVATKYGEISISFIDEQKYQFTYSDQFGLKKHRSE